MKRVSLALLGFISVIGTIFSLSFILAWPAKAKDEVVKGEIIEVSDVGGVKIISRNHGFILNTNIDRFENKKIVQVGQCVLLQVTAYSYRLSAPQFIPKGGQIIDLCPAA